MTALPDLTIEVRRRHVACEAIFVGVMLRGTLLGEWKVSLRQGGDSNCRFVAYTHSPPTIVWQER